MKNNPESAQDTKGNYQMKENSKRAGNTDTKSQNRIKRNPKSMRC